MEETQYTAVVAFIFGSLPIAKYVLLWTWPPYNRKHMLYGCLSMAAASVFFVLSQNDALDPLKVLHGLTQVTLWLLSSLTLVT